MARSIFGIYRRMGLGTRLILLHFVVLAVAMGLVFLVVDQVVSGSLLRSLDAELADEAREYAHAAGMRSPDQSIGSFSAAYANTLVPGTTLVVIRLSDGTTVASSSAQALQGSPQVQRWLANPPSAPVLTAIKAGGQSYHAMATPIVINGQRAGEFIAAASLAKARHESREWLMIAGAEAAAAVIIALSSTYLILRRVLGIVGRVTEAADVIGRQGLQYRLAYRGPDDEIGRLARTFDRMLSGMDSAFTAQRQLLSDVSHQLRTPLTVIRGHLEVLRRGGFDDQAEVRETVDLVLDELDHTASLVDRLLLLGRSMEPDFIESQRVDLRALMGEVFEAGQALAPRRWSLGSVPDVVILCDPVKLRGALLNLIDNAVKATGPDQFIALEAHVGDELVLAVADGGRGIPEGQQTRAFERFARPGATDEPGSGLGLAIVKAVAEGHGGHVTIESSPGSGTVVRIVLPRRCVEQPLEGAADEQVAVTP